MNVATVNRALGIPFTSKPTHAQLFALATNATQTPHIRNSAKELIRGRRYAPLSTFRNTQPLQ
jgi:hypothetical protein